MIALATIPGSAARSAEEYKMFKYIQYSGLFDRLHFIPVAIETSGPQSLRFLKQIGHKPALERHKPME